MQATEEAATSAPQVPAYGMFAVAREPSKFPPQGPFHLSREAALLYGAERWSACESFVTARVERPELAFGVAAQVIARHARRCLIEHLGVARDLVDLDRLVPPPSELEDPRLIKALEDALQRYFGPGADLEPSGWAPTEIQVHRIP